MLRALLRPSAAVVAAAALGLSLAGPVGGSASAAPSPARALVEGPQVGECHDLGWAEVMAVSDPDPAVPCAEHHTTVTIEVVTYDDPDWWDDPASGRILGNRCREALAATFGGASRGLEMSAYRLYYFFPTKAQRENGAQWARCDIALSGAKAVPALPETIQTDLSQVPDDDAVTRCVAKKDDKWWWTVCSRPHGYRAQYAIKFTHDTYPGDKKAQEFALTKCQRKITSGRFFYAWPGKADWKAGWRHAVCYPRNSGRVAGPAEPRTIRSVAAAPRLG